MSKYPFFAKKGRPSDAERQLCKKINNKINSGVISQKEIDEFIKSNGSPETQDDLETLYSLITGEDAVEKNVQSNNDDYDDYEESDYDNVDNNSNTQNINNKSNIGQNSGQNVGQKENPINFTPFDEPVIERSYTK